MNAKFKCSNCGAEMTNLTFSMGKKQWLIGLVAMLPMVVVLIWMQYSLFAPKGDFVSEIEISLLNTRYGESQISILGTLKNNGTHTWSRVTVEAEFYDEGGQFLDEVSESFSVTLIPESEEHFSIGFHHSNKELLKDNPKVVLKISSADTDRF